MVKHVYLLLELVGTIFLSLTEVIRCARYCTIRSPKHYMYNVLIIEQNVV